MSFIEINAKKNLGECDICIEGMARGNTLILTYCCNTYFHKDCVKELENCPLCRGQHYQKSIEKPEPKPVERVVEKVVEKVVYRNNPNEVFFRDNSQNPDPHTLGINTSLGWAPLN